MRRSQLFSAIAVLTLALAGCGGDSGPKKGALMAPALLNPAAYRAEGIPGQFGDTAPHDWAGITPAYHGVHGIDAARYQGLIDWPRARATGVSFAWLKATEGGDRIDPGFAPNARAARAAGVPVGGYHFFYFCRTAAEQAEWFIRNVPRVKGDLPPVLDIEWNHTSPSCQLRPDPAKVRAEMRTFLEILRAHYHVTPVIYTTVDFWADNDLGKMRGYDFWLRSVADHPSVRYPGASWTFWQYTGTGVVPGIGGTVDLNAFAGGPAEWAAWLAARRQR